MMLVMMRTDVVAFVMLSGIAVMLFSQRSGICGGDRSQSQNANGQIYEFFHSCCCRRSAQQNSYTFSNLH